MRYIKTFENIEKKPWEVPVDKWYYGKDTHRNNKGYDSYDHIKDPEILEYFKTILNITISEDFKYEIKRYTSGTFWENPYDTMHNGSNGVGYVGFNGPHSEHNAGYIEVNISKKDKSLLSKRGKNINQIFKDEMEYRNEMTNVVYPIISKIIERASIIDYSLEIKKSIIKFEVSVLFDAADEYMLKINKN